MSRFLLPMGLLLLLAASAQAQLNGTYTVGGISPAYATLTAAVADLNSMGISGPVTFNIRPGTYDERVTLLPITRTGNPDDLVTFQRQSGTVTWINSTATSTTNWIVKLSGADYVTFRRITFEATEPTNTYGRLIKPQSGATHNTFSLCTFNGFLGVNSDETSLIYQGSDTNDGPSTFSFNTFNNGYLGIDYDFGFGGSFTSDGLNITGNTFSGQTKGASITRGLETIIEDNTVTNAIWATSDYVALFVQSAGSRIQRNMIDLGDGATGIRLQNSGDISPNNDLVANNMVSIHAGTAVWGISVSKPDALIYFNTVRMSNVGTPSAALHLADIAPDAEMIPRNNLLIHEGGGFALDVDNQSSIQDLKDADYNNYYTTGSFPISLDGTFQTLSSWQSLMGMDLHSVSKPVTFVNPLGGHDLHLSGASVGDVDLFSMPLPEVTQDIDGTTRSAIGPYMGADEAATPIALQMNLTVLLSGALTGTALPMRTDLNSNGLLEAHAQDSPYDSAPFSCGLDETVDSGFFDANLGIVDWVCVQLRTGDPNSPPMTVVREQPAFLGSDARVYSYTDGTTDPVFAAEPGLYWVVIDHRNHLSVMSGTQVNASSGLGVYDFASLDGFGTNAQQGVSGGLFAMWGGDGDANGSTTAFDFLNTWLPINGGSPGYDAGDFNMDGSGTAFDFLVVWLPANGQASQVP